MVSSGRQAIARILLIFCIAVCSQAQTNPPKEPTASISGKVTIKGKGAPGITLIAADPNFYSPWGRTRYRATTDQSGKYTISNLPAGKYRVEPRALAFAMENEQGGSTLTIADGETIEDINFVLMRGGVITGKITDSDGQPIVEVPVTLATVNDQSQIVRTQEGHNNFTTDDRGIYRLFGLRPGKYKVYVDDGSPRTSASFSLGTFHPSTTDEAKATVIELSEGSEIKDVDIVLVKRASSGFRVTGQIVDGETGKPLPNIGYGLIQTFENGGGSSHSGSRTNANGGFTFENLLPGKYAIFIDSRSDSNLRANASPFEVTDRDITGLVVKTRKGSTLSGVVVVEGDEAVNKKLSQMRIYAYVEPRDMHDNYASGGAVQPDGSFTIKGLRSGTARLSASFGFRSAALEIVRVERDGVVQPSGISIQDSEDVTGLRLVVKQNTGAIRGQVKLEDGELPASAQLVLSINFLDGTPTRGYGSDHIDSRGRFYVEGLAAGRYEVRVGLILGGRLQQPSSGSKKEVLVADNAVSEVVLTVKLKPDTDEEDDDP